MPIEHIKTNTARMSKDLEQMHSIIEKMKGDLNSLIQSSTELDEMWDGPSSEAFKAVFQQDINALSSVLKNLESIYNYTSNAKTEYERCDEAVKNALEAIKA